jgi:hypothetical protein
MLEFEYTTHGPLPWAVVRTNLIRLEWDCGRLTYTRFYNGDTEKPGISHAFGLADSYTVWSIAKMIHWGCSGRSMTRVREIEDQIRAFVEAGPAGGS